MPEKNYAEPPDPATGSELTETQPTSLISRRLHDFFAEQGLPRHKHSSQLATILGLSRSGAFRKFQDGAFSATDLQSLARHFQVDVSLLLSSHPVDADQSNGEAKPASIVIGGRTMACKALIGTELGRHEHCELVATLQGAEWLVQPYAEASGGQRHRVHQLTVIPTQRQLPRIAVLEDAADLAANLKDALEGAGFRVEVFSSASELSYESAVAPFDAYVVDWWLNGKTSAAVLQTIRKAQPSAPLILTTGAIANGNAAEDDIARIAMALRVQVIEKPFRLALLISQVKQLLGETS
ncbi:hypothetical protein B2J86_02300 [Acidovorax sp. SRB_14]|uniref:helix-turn-helix domain-containing protein n=1 Tax=unclassified Acidovorax TaxID=2684926 RepID=UPI00145CD6D3|nr:MULTISPECIES: helix-turn-helix domain-containing protein [unclassified Acidovorax]NMM76279.1 hypothetical protein [Acidovorax sp. SRB_24]NMM76371.1 hypothetical protein [Acidovorax sp. SRB_24]NMM79769.1 hypothetical protein [Acidovorax sp. SRB_14]NMM84889.1 hypothetical protein [Rhodococcus sp. SRB_17]